MTDRIDALKLFVRTAQTRSFSRAGHDMGLSQPVTSRTISALEKELGVALFTRTTRAVALTDDGREFLARVEPILSDLEEAYHALGRTPSLRGALRVGMSSTFAIREIIPRLPRFLAMHPSLRLELLSSDQRQDLVLEGVDVALRLGKLPDSAATSKRLGIWRRVALAAPSYLAKMGTPTTPVDLTNHQIIAWPLGLGTGCTFRKGSKQVKVKPQSRLSATLNEAAIAGAIAGLGIVITGVTDTLMELRSGQLMVVLPDWILEPIEAHALYAGGRTAKPAARAFTDFLIEDLRRSRPE